MRRKFGILIFCLLAIVLRTGLAASPVVEVGIYKLEPFLSEKQPNHGVMTELTVAALERAGYSVKVTLYPFARLMYGLENGSVDLAPGITFTEDRKRFLDFSEPIYFLDMGFIFKRGRIHYHQATDLRGHTGGVMRGSFWEGVLAGAGVTYETVSELQNNIRKLIANRVDFICMPREVAFYMLEAEGEKADGYEFALYAKDPQLVGVSRRSQHQALLTDFQRGLKLLRNDGGYRKILARYGQ